MRGLKDANCCKRGRCQEAQRKKLGAPKREFLAREAHARGLGNSTSVVEEMHADELLHPSL